MNTELAGSVAVVTGGGKGIGQTISLSLAKSGCDVIIVGRDQVALDNTAASIRTLGCRAFSVVADITDAEQLGRISQVIEQDCAGRVDIIVTAAGTRDHMNQSIAEIDIEAFDNVMQGNLNGSLLPIRSVLPFMMKRRHGKVVTISGVFGLRAKANHAAGCVSKWALEGLTRVMALELGPYNINVNAICPGYVEGPRSSAGIARAAQNSGIDADQARANLLAATALKRLSTPDDIANAVLFLVSENSRNITGQDIVIDAGWTL